MLLFDIRKVCRTKIFTNIRFFSYRNFLYSQINQHSKDYSYIEIDSKRSEVCNHDYKQPRAGKTNL